MRYGLKPIAVDSNTHMLTLPCVSALTHIVFQVQHHPHSCLINSTATRTKFMFTLNLPKTIHDQDVFFFERGPEFLYVSFTLKRYRVGCWKICTNSPDNKAGTFQFRTKMNSTYNNFVGCIKHPTKGFQNSQSKSNVA